jgi:hypothetical protein
MRCNSAPGFNATVLQDQGTALPLRDLESISFPLTQTLQMTTRTMTSTPPLLPPPPNPASTTPPCIDPIPSTNNVDPPMVLPTNNGALHDMMAIAGPVDGMDIKRHTVII